MAFSRSFYNMDGKEVAGTWYDSERRRWRVSTVPVLAFATEQEAVNCFYDRCDPETGLVNLRLLMAGRAQKSRSRTRRGSVLETPMKSDDGVVAEVGLEPTRTVKCAGF
jgi:hypothetical protein